MSTRSQLRFVQTRTYDDPDGDGEVESHSAAQVYRHSDGYPEAVLPDLAQLKAIQDATGTQRDPSYVAANFIFLGKLRSMGFYLGDEDRGFTTDELTRFIKEGDTSVFESVGQASFLLGHGVEEVGGIHGDEEYIYIVDIGNRDGDWTVHVSEHAVFPRWSEGTGQEFEDATWMYEGPLNDGIAQVV